MIEYREMNVQVIINTRSKLARNERALALIRKKFGASLHGIAETTCAKDAAEATRNAAKSNIDTLVVVGGDGTVNGILNKLAGTGIALGVIPSGTANDLASVHNLTADVSRACDVVLQRQVRAVDLIAVNGRYFATGGGLGLPSRIAADANAIKSRSGSGKLLHSMLGSKLYVMSALATLLKNAPDENSLAIRWNRRSLVADSLSLMINNQSFVGRHFHLSPGAINNDGLFDVCLIENSRSRARIAAILLRVLTGSHTNLPAVTTWRAQKLNVRAEKPLAFFADGEDLLTETDFTVRISPGSLNLIVPGDQRRARTNTKQEVISETECLLSHVAVICREVGINAGLHVPDATEFLTEGARVRLDGFEGHMERINSP